MKKLISILLILLVGSSHIQAQDCNQLPKDEKVELEEFVKIICRKLNTFRRKSDKEAGKKIEQAIIDYLNLDKNSTDYNYKIKITEFWNKYNDCFICYNEYSHNRTPQQFIKRVIDMMLYNEILHTFLLSDSEDYPINVNSVQVINGEKETILDYLDKILALEEEDTGYDFNDMIELRFKLIEKYGAKKASDLKE